jgi:hypothetical protein
MKAETTTIAIAAPKRTGHPWQVFGRYEGPDDRFVFGVREFARRSEAEAHAGRMVLKHGADVLERYGKTGQLVLSEGD